MDRAERRAVGFRRLGLCCGWRLGADQLKALDDQLQIGGFAFAGKLDREAREGAIDREAAGRRGLLRFDGRNVGIRIGHREVSFHIAIAKRMSRSAPSSSIESSDLPKRANSSV